MTIENLRDLCLSFPNATEEIKWEDHLCFCVKGKIFIITSPDRIPVNASFKCSPDDFSELIQREGIVPAPYLARYFWVQVEDISSLGDTEWRTALETSYRLVVEGTKKGRK